MCYILYHKISHIYTVETLYDLFNCNSKIAVCNLKFFISISCFSKSLFSSKSNFSWINFILWLCWLWNADCCMSIREALEEAQLVILSWYVFCFLVTLACKQIIVINDIRLNYYKKFTPHIEYSNIKK